MAPLAWLALRQVCTRHCSQLPPPPFCFVSTRTMCPSQRSKASVPLTVTSGETCLQVLSGLQPGSWQWEGCVHGTASFLPLGVMPFLTLGSSSRGSRQMRRSWLRLWRESCEVAQGGLPSLPIATGFCVRSGEGGAPSL